MKLMMENKDSTEDVQNLINKFEKGELSIESFKSTIKAQEDTLIAKKAKQRMILAIASSVGAAGIAGIISSIIDIALYQTLNDNDIPLIVPPSILTILFSGGVYYGASQKNDIGDTIIKTLGVNTKNVVDTQVQTIQNNINNIITSIRNIPKNLSKAINKKIDDTQKNAKAKIDDTVNDIKNFPSTISKAAIDSAEATTNAASKAVQNAANDAMTSIKEAPGKATNYVVTETNRAINDATTAIVEAPGKAADAVTKTVKEQVDGIIEILPIPKSEPISKKPISSSSSSSSVRK